MIETLAASLPAGATEGESMMYRDQLLPELEAIARRAARSEDVAVAWTELKRRGGSWVFRVFIERLEGEVDLGDCERVSRRLGLLLDVEDPIESSYTLEVSTPGLDRPLHGAEDFRRFEGKLARVQLSEAVEGRRKLLGRLRGVDDESLVLELADTGERVRLPLARVESARLEVEIEGFSSGKKKEARA